MKWTNTKTAIACVVAVVVAGTIVLVETAGAHKTKNGARPAAPQSPEIQKQLAQLSPDAQLSPFTAVEFSGGTVTVTFSGVDYQLVAIDDLSVADLLDFCKRQYKDAWQKRFAEDLVVVLSDMGHPVNADFTINLMLVDPKTGEKKNVGHAPMTAENRRAVHKMLSMN